MFNERVGLGIWITPLCSIFSQSGRVGASCVMLNFQSCPALQYSKVAEKIKVAGVSKLVRAKDVPSFCGE